MKPPEFKVEQIDHVHVFVADQYEAARWYQQILGMEILPQYRDWATEDGPLMISSDGGNTKLALFKRRASQKTGEKKTIAFRVGSAGFAAFLKHLEKNEVKDETGKRVTARDVVDHEKAFSIYFNDPDGNPYEVTTYDYQLVLQHLHDHPT
jgi:catechol 2,3-dioxygenase-like lactoylglutathione lyase family enzyme